MRITKGMRSGLAAMILVAVAGMSASPSHSMTVPVNTPFAGSSDQIFGNGDAATYSVGLGTSDSSFYIDFQVASTGTVSFGAGNEGAALADIDITGVSLQNISAGTNVVPASAPIIFSEGAGPNNPSPFSGQLHSDAFFAAFAGLVSGTTYRLLVDVDVHDTSGSPFGGVSDVFTGQISFNVVPIPPALALFATGLLGLGILSRRRRRTAVPA